MILEKDRDFYNTLLASVLEATARNKDSATDRAAVVVAEISNKELTDIEIRDAWCSHEAPEARAAAALSVEISSELLKRGVLEDNPLVQEALARNERTPEDLLKALAVVKHENVRLQVAKNRNTPFSAIASLQNDSSELVRQAVESRQL